MIFISKFKLNVKAILYEKYLNVKKIFKVLEFSNSESAKHTSVGLVYVEEMGSEERSLEGWELFGIQGIPFRLALTRRKTKLAVYLISL